MVEDDDPPQRRGLREDALQPPCLRVRDGVRVEHDQLDVLDAAHVVRRRHAEELELVAAAVDREVVVPDRPRDADSRSAQPPERGIQFVANDAPRV